MEPTQAYYMINVSEDQKAYIDANWDHKPSGHHAYQSLRDIKAIVDGKVKVVYTARLSEVDGKGEFAVKDAKQLTKSQVITLAEQSTEDIYGGYAQACVKKAATGPLGRLGMWMVSVWPWSEKNYVSALYKEIMDKIDDAKQHTPQEERIGKIEKPTPKPLGTLNVLVDQSKKLSKSGETFALKAEQLKEKTVAQWDFLKKFDVLGLFAKDVQKDEIVIREEKPVKTDTQKQGLTGKLVESSSTFSNNAQKFNETMQRRAAAYAKMSFTEKLKVDLFGWPNDQ